MLLCILWVVSLLYGEMLTFWVPSIWSCSWPPLLRSTSLSSSAMEAQHPGNFVKIAVVADPQLMDKTSLGLPPKSLALEISQFYTDLFMRRAFLASILPLKPDAILFLGDYFDGGPSLSDEEWKESSSRFKHIFDLKTQGKRNIQVYHLSGNHDIGYASVLSHKPEVVRRYEQEFGIRNYRFTVGKVEFVVVDAQTLDGHSQGSLTSASWDFIKNVSMDVNLNPRVLLTHIPLYRPDWTTCGPYRYSPVINQRVFRAIHDQEIVYQNYITEEKSKYLLDLLRPVLILSGHDHDQCTVTHMSKHGPVMEHTVGTISWQQGNLYPSFMLLSASNDTIQNDSSLQDAISTQLCFLPMQTHIYIWYLFQFVLTLLALLLWPTNGLGSWRHCRVFMEYTRSLISSNILRSGAKEKNEDENCEYEMIWDAEGSMHLVKKTSKAPLTRSSERGLSERGNAVMRSTAKRQISQETELSTAVDMNMDVELDMMAKLPPRASKSRTKKVIRRLMRTLRMLTVIAAVNVPLYMMLLFKDWTEQ